MNHVKTKLLLHICCAPDATVVVSGFKSIYDITCYFYNPNIHPIEEYEKRLGEMRKLSDYLDVPLYCEEYDPDNWFKLIKGLENEPEGGKRCRICFRMRLEKTLLFAKKHNFGMFTTVLTVSPYKSAVTINDIGNEISKQSFVKFLAADFKKNDGFKKSIELCKKYGIYRQNYCGCIFSRQLSVVGAQYIEPPTAILWKN